MIDSEEHDHLGRGLERLKRTNDEPKTEPEKEQSEKGAIKKEFEQYKIARKISGGRKPENGANVHLNLISVIQTIKTRGQDHLLAGPSIHLASHG